MIKLILTTYTSERDRNGNCYHSGVVRSTVTGERVKFRETGGRENLPQFARRAGLEWEDLNYEAVTLPIREYNRLTKAWPYRSTEDTIAELRRLAGLPALAKA